MVADCAILNVCEMLFHVQILTTMLEDASLGSVG